MLYYHPAAYQSQDLMRNIAADSSTDSSMATVGPSPVNAHLEACRRRAVQYASGHSGKAERFASLGRVWVVVTSRGGAGAGVHGPAQGERHQPRDAHRGAPPGVHDPHVRGPRRHAPPRVRQRPGHRHGHQVPAHPSPTNPTLLSPPEGWHTCTCACTNTSSSDPIPHPCHSC